MNKLLLTLSGIFCLLPMIVFAEDGIGVAYEEGKHYDQLAIPLRTRDAAKIEVVEYFSYGCPHCYQFDAVISSWEAGLADDVVFKRTPAIWNQDYQVYAQTYYTAEALNVLDKTHQPLFQAIHVSRQQLNDPQAMAFFFNGFGIDPLDFAKVYQSFGVRAAVQQAEARGRAYRATSVPSIIVNGKYRIEGKHTGSNTGMLPVADYLIKKERLAMAKGQ